MSRRFPDLEIYIKRVDVEAVTAWLQSNFTLVRTETTSEHTVCHLQSNDKPGKPGLSDQADMQCVILQKAVKGGYVSVWFKQNNTAWDTDRDCAEQAYAYFSALGDTEIRCSTGGWLGEDEGGWFRFTKDGIQTVNWF
jgi:hypothetical protein